MASGTIPQQPVHPDIEEVLLTEDRIRERVAEMARQITLDYDGRTLHLVCVLRGAAMFAMDLMRSLPASTTIDFMAISSWGGGTSSTGVARILKDLEDDVDGKHVLLVEDIIDSGLTLCHVTGLLSQRKVASVHLCALLNKPEARKMECEARYVGFSIPNRFVVGYGLDYDGRYRGLPYVGVLKPHIYGGR